MEHEKVASEKWSQRKNKNFWKWSWIEIEKNATRKKNPEMKWSQGHGKIRSEVTSLLHPPPLRDLKISSVRECDVQRISECCCFRTSQPDNILDCRHWSTATESWAPKVWLRFCVPSKTTDAYAGPSWSEDSQLDLRYSYPPSSSPAWEPLTPERLYLVPMKPRR